jgi:TetR/AcrR family transcriptional repressor of nem operon
MTQLVGTKKMILDIAEDLFLEGGYGSFSYKHISSSLGIKNAAVHYHYPTKPDLGTAIIVRARRRFERWHEDIDKRDLDPAAKLDEFFQLFRYFLDAGKICFGGALGINFTALPAKMQEDSQGLGSDFLSWLDNLLREGRSEGVFTFRGEPKDQAIVILSSLQGILQMARNYGPSCFDIVVKQIIRSMEV